MRQQNSEPLDGAKGGRLGYAQGSGEATLTATHGTRARPLWTVGVSPRLTPGGLMRLFASLMLATWVVGGSVPVDAQTTMQFGLGVASVGGDFGTAGTRSYESTEFTVPGLGSAPELSISIGWYGSRTRWGLSHLRSNPPATLSGLLSTEAALRTWQLDLGLYPWLELSKRVTPGLELGLGYTKLSVPGGTAPGGVIPDASYRGVSPNVGVGLLVRLTDLLTLNLRASRAFLSFGNAEADDSGIVPLDPAVSGATDRASVGLSLRFGVGGA